MSKMIEEMIFNGETKGKSCAICKLKIDKNQEILCCPQCNFLFHKEHMIEWLKISAYCPVCNADFSKIIKKYKELLHREKIDLLTRNQQQDYELFFSNTKLLSSSSSVKITLMIFGILLGFVPVIAVSFLSPFPQSIYFLVFFIIFSWFGAILFALVVESFKKTIDNYWNKMYLSKEKILITSELNDDLEINSEDIIRIDLIREQTTSSKYTPLQYFITLRIFTQKNKVYLFGKIYQSDTEIENLAIHNKLKREISNLFQIDVREPKQGLAYFIGRYKKYLLFSTLIHMLLSIICVLISYFVIS